MKEQANFRKKIEEFKTNSPGKVWVLWVVVKNILKLIEESETDTDVVHALARLSSRS